MILINMNFKKMPLVYEMIWKVTLLGEGNKVFFGRSCCCTATSLIFYKILQTIMYSFI